MKGGFTMHVANGIGRFTSFVFRKLGISNDFTVPDIGIGRRYAFLEFQFQGIIPRGNKRTFFTGHDLMAIMYRLEQYIKGEEVRKKQFAISEPFCGLSNSGYSRQVRIWQQFQYALGGLDD